MNLIELANKVIDAAELEGIDFMVVGALAAGTYGVPRSTKDVDLLVGIDSNKKTDALIARLRPLVTFGCKIPLHRMECLIPYFVNVHSFPPRHEFPMPQPAIGAERFPAR
jgi:predicted nucleotidyltransferase